MQFNPPKNTERFFWTQHVIFKMKQYGLSAQRILGVIHNPQRKEEGIVKNTIAVMKPISEKLVKGKKTWKQEVWIMYQKNKKEVESKKKSSRIKIISAWRYPGISPKKNPIPEKILEELESVEQNIFT